MIRFYRGVLEEEFDEALPLIQRHWSEIAWKRDKIPLSVNKEQYLMMEEKGIIACYIGRDNGQMVAYALFFLMSHPHYSKTLYATNDVIYVQPESRGMTGTKFIDFIEEDLRRSGVQTILYHVKESLNWGKLLERKGFEPVDRVWQKWIGD